MQIVSNRGSINYLSFNQDGSCITVGTDRGFRIFNTVPFKPLYSRDFPDGANVVSMLYRSAILAIVGGGSNGRYPKEAVTLYDDQSGRTLGEVNFRTPVLNVQLTRDKIFVVFETKIFVYNLTDLRLIDSFDTFSNPYGLISVVGERDCMIATVGLAAGDVVIRRYGATMGSSFLTHKCHENDIRAISFSQDGRFVATASSKGTLIRVWTTDSFTKVKELRRGTEKADIMSIAFSPDGCILGVTSNRQTLHCFYVSKPANYQMGGQEHQDNKKNPLHFLAPIAKYFDSEWSFAKFTLNDSNSIARFMSSDCIVVLCGDGSYFKLRIAQNLIEKESFFSMLSDK